MQDTINWGIQKILFRDKYIKEIEPQRRKFFTKFPKF